MEGRCKRPSTSYSIGFRSWISASSKMEARARVVPCSLVLFGALVAAFAVRRRLQVKGAGAMVSRERDSRESDDLMGFPELPGSWSTRVT